MKIPYLALRLLLITGSMAAQASDEEEIINPKGHFYFGAEIGLNTITSYSYDEPSGSFQAGLAAEYYFARHWSVTGRLKYFKTGASFERYDMPNRFNGAVLSVPVTLKWEFRIFKNLSGSLKAGVAYNHETKSDYNFAPTANTNHSGSFGSLNTGIGLTYFISKKMGVYLDFEEFTLGGYKGYHDAGGVDLNLNPFEDTYTTNSLVNLGFKYSFEK